MTQTHDQSSGDVVSAGSLPVVAERARAYPPLWRNRDYMLLWCGQLVSSTGSQISLLAFPLLVLAVTGSPAQAGIVGALRGLPFALLCLPAGALVDRWDRKKVMLICDSGRALALASIPLALWLGNLSFLQLCLVALTEGTLMTFFSIAEMTCLPHVVPREQLPSATAQNQAIDSTSWTLGPFLGGLLYGVGRLVPFLLTSITFGCSVVSLLFMRARFQGEREQVQRHIWREIGEGLVWIWRDALLRFLAVLTFCLVMPSIGFTLILISLAQNEHASPLAVGILIGGGGIGSILGALLTQTLQRRFTFGQLTIASAWVWAGSWLGLAIAPNIVVLGITNAISFIIVPIFLSVQFSYRLLAVPDHLQGRVQSVYRLLSYGSQPVGMALTGLLIQGIGPVWTVIVLFVPQGIIALFATLYRPLRAAPLLSELA
ncbi:MAG TPA: MFS transporter [Ktedonobacteraceae bacterium]